MINHLMGQSANPQPEIGMGATILMWSDRRAATIIEVSKNGRIVTTREDEAIRTDGHGVSDAQSYRYEPNPLGHTQQFSLRKNGRWIAVGSTMADGGGVAFGFRRAYYDYSF
jgi:hypothetical protein